MPPGSLIKTALYSLAWLPLPVLHGLGTCLGWCLWMAPARPKKITAANIALCWPELTTAQQHTLTRKSLAETGKTLFETGALWLRPGKQTLGLIKQVNGSALVKQAQAKGRGVILATPHLGAWEGAGLYCADRFDISCPYRPPRKPGMEQFINTARSRLGGHYIEANAQGTRLLYKTLRQGRVIAMLPDQEPQTGAGLFAPFFGTPAYSMVLLARIAKRAAAPVIFVCCERLPWGRGYHLHFREMPDITNATTMKAAVKATNKAVEYCVRQCPEQYQWSYRRFRTRPEGEKLLY
jgi:KDO2-lipid IV(A) lauroyltransferase